MILPGLVAVLLIAGQRPLPEVVVRADDTPVDHSCRLVMPPGLVLEDAAGDGLVQVVADGVRVEMAPGSVLRGAPADAPPDTLTGRGVVVEDHADVTLDGLRLAGFQAGVVARHADRLRLLDVTVTDGFRQRLASLPDAPDDGADWLAPHDNDQGQWLARYGAALAVASSTNVTVRGCRARRVQDGLILDRVEGADVRGNDFSFLSGWGLALWRSSGNVIAGNALDFCVRGYSHGVYNRGQDSAGLLMFEQCCRNLVQGNSITHGGDGVFAFAGREALGQRDPELDLRRRGIADNLFLDNDLSFAAAHGLELTFGFGNVVRENRLVGNAICGLWGGYSQDTRIEGNRFERNGGAGYALERGGVDIEHGQRNRIARNVFVGNACGVHLWWDPDPGLVDGSWARVNGAACADNAVLDNRFEGDELAVQLRHAERTVLSGNVFVDVGRERDLQDSPVLAEADAVPAPRPGELPGPLTLSAPGPLGARADLGGREAIVLGRWGPWDHASPLLRPLSAAPDRHAFELLGLPADAPVTLTGQGLHLGRTGRRLELLADGDRPGVWPYRLEVPGTDPPQIESGCLSRLRWVVTVFPCRADPREDEQAWQAAADGEHAVSVRLDALDLRFGAGGPADLPALAGAAGAAGALPGPDHFGVRARAAVPLAAGGWRLVVLSDDGVRVRVDGDLVVDDWTWHGPTREVGRFRLGAPTTVALQVEHFELDGWAVLSVALEPDT